MSYFAGKVMDGPHKGGFVEHSADHVNLELVLKNRALLTPTINPEPMPDQLRLVTYAYHDGDENKRRGWYVK